MKFVVESERDRQDSTLMILLLDGYRGHIQFDFLNYMKENRIVVIAVPTHTSHVLQPLDVTVLGPCKNYLQE